MDGDEIAACLLGSTDVAQPMEVRVIAGPAGLVAVAPEPVLARVRRLVEREPDPIVAFVEILSLLAAGCEDAQEELVDGATELSGTLGGLHSAEPRRVDRARNTFLAAGSTAAQTYQMLGDVLTLQATTISERLTLISVLFLPLTVITGFFGMNFGWLVDAIAGPGTFWVLGVVFPAAVVLAIMRLIRRMGVVQD